MSDGHSYCLLILFFFEEQLIAPLTANHVCIEMIQAFNEMCRYKLGDNFSMAKIWLLEDLKILRRH